MIVTPKTRRRLAGMGIGSLIAFLAVNLLFDPNPNSHEPLFAFDAWCYDRLLIHRSVPPQEEGAPIPEVFILAFDEDSFDNLKTLPDPRLAQWPWPPSLFAQVINRLKRLGVTAIGIDKLFNESHLLDPLDNPNQLEKELATACENHGKVILASKFETVFPDGISQYELIREPLDILLQSAASGFTSLPKDPDKSIRSAYISRKLDNMEYLSFAAQIVRQYKNLSAEDLVLNQEEYSILGDITIPLRHETFSIAYDGERIQTFPFYVFVDEFYEIYSEILFSPAVDVGVESFDINRFKNSIVLLGATSGELIHDQHKTPIQADMIPGVEIHANIIKTLLSKYFIRHADDALQMWGTFFITVGICALSAFASIRNSIIASICAIFGWIAGASLALLYGVLAIRIITPVVCIFTGAAASISYRFIFEEREKRYLKRLFSKATDTKLVEQLLANPELVKLGGERRRVTILFSDIRSFSTLSETMDPEALLTFLNQYFSSVTEVIFRNHGMIDKFIGDAVMAIFGAPVPSDDHTYWACKTGVEMLRVQKEIAESRGDETPFRIGIGIHTGFVVLGNLGSEKRSDYTCIGDAVNIASRIEGINKTLKTELLISEDTYNEIRDLAEVRNVGETEIRGRKGTVLLYELRNIREGGILDGNQEGKGDQ